ncbi:MAG: apolipoprotein N-acyltransferase [Pelagibacteraceae bacterium TMED216]|nr:MAG: apolipoprotein N-acyltransferase [Pelagibacteraceae bacterium TMED216]|tara:strand:- start:1546 stop:3105 length:1560 start_codon:yes stop_codon:yes gene_type:complete
MIEKIKNSKILILYILPFIFGSVSILSFEPFNLIFFNFITISFLFLSLSFVNKRSMSTFRKKKNYLINFFKIGYFFGLGFFLFGNYWIAYSLTFDPTLKILIPFTLLAVPSFLSLFFGLGFMLIGPLLKNNFTSILIFSSGLSLIDFMRGKILTGFPWNSWAYSLSWFTEFIQISNFLGFYAFNLITITFYCIPAIIFFKNYKYKNLFVISNLLIIFCFYLLGSYIINKNDADLINQKNFVNFKVVSPNFNIKNNANLENLENNLEKLIRYSEPDEKKETFFIWPESITSGAYYSDLLKFKDLIRKNFSKKHFIVLGTNIESKNRKFFYNSFIILNNNLEIIYRYDKNKLVPFGEFLPFENFLESIGFKKITQGYGSFSRGTSVNNFEYLGLNILPMICYEIIFPELVQRSSESTNLIINISEDGWFGKTIGPYQHFSKSIFRSVENNSYTIRSANKGISAIINNKGKVIKRLEPFEAGTIELEVPILSRNFKNKNDLIFFILLFTYTTTFLIFRKKNE